MNKRFTKNDFIFLIGIFIVAVAIFVAFRFWGRIDGSQIVITIDGTKHGTYSLSENREIPIETEDGNNLLVIKDGIAKMIKADCPDQLCVHQKGISLEKETIVCLPHKVVITVESGNFNKIDAVAN